MKESVVLEDANGAHFVLEPTTLVIALDETGHESFADPNHRVFGIGGCGFMAADYGRLIAEPWDYMCQTFFPDVTRPLHASELPKPPSAEQLDALRHFFEEFQFFRLATTIRHDASIDSEIEIIDIVGKSILQRVADIAKQTQFTRVAVVLEHSERLGARILRSLSGSKIRRGQRELPIELGTLPSSACEPMLEVADFIIHTSGAQTRERDGAREVRKDFVSIFRNVDDRLTSFFEITGVAGGP